MINIKDTHVLIDEQGVAVLSGSLSEMLEAFEELRAEGFEKIVIRPIEPDFPAFPGRS